MTKRGKFVLRGTAAGLSVLASRACALPAAAADASPNTQSGLIAGLAVAGAATLVATALYCYERRRAARERAARTLIDDELSALLDTPPSGAMVWHGARDAGQTIVTPGLIDLLGVEPGTIGRFANLAGHFAQAEFDCLGEEVDALRGHGVPFTDTVSDAADERLFEVNGTPVSGGPGQTSALWINDITARGREIKILSGQLDERDALARAHHARLETLSLPAWERDEAGALVWCNAAYAEWAETTPSQAVVGGVELAPVRAPDAPAPIAREARTLGEPKADDAMRSCVANATWWRSPRRPSPWETAPSASPSTSLCSKQPRANSPVMPRPMPRCWRPWAVRSRFTAPIRG